MRPVEYDIKKGWFKNIEGDLLEAMMNAWVIPALYPANPWIFGAPLISGHESSLGVCDCALFLGPYALDPLLGRLLCGML